MQQMNLPGQTSEDHFNGSQDDLGEWFKVRLNGFGEADLQVVEHEELCRASCGVNRSHPSSFRLPRRWFARTEPLEKSVKAGRGTSPDAQPLLVPVLQVWQ